MVSCEEFSICETVTSGSLLRFGALRDELAHLVSHPLANLLARLAALIALGLCFGLAARLLVDASLVP